MGLISKIKGVFKRKKAAPAAPAIVVPPPVVLETKPDPLSEFVEGLRLDYESRVATLRGLEVESVSDSLRSKWRARREEVEDLLKELPKQSGGNP